MTLDFRRWVKKNQGFCNISVNISWQLWLKAVSTRTRQARRPKICLRILGHAGRLLNKFQADSLARSRDLECEKWKKLPKVGPRPTTESVDRPHFRRFSMRKHFRRFSKFSISTIPWKSTKMSAVDAPSGRRRPTFGKFFHFRTPISRDLVKGTAWNLCRSCPACSSMRKKILGCRACFARPETAFNQSCHEILTEMLQNLSDLLKSNDMFLMVCLRNFGNSLCNPPSCARMDALTPDTTQKAWLKSDTESSCLKKRPL